MPPVPPRRGRRRLLLLALVLATAGAGPLAASGPLAAPGDARAVAGNAGRTVAIVARGTSHPLGSGVWIGEGRVLTCMHVTRIHPQLPRRHAPGDLEVVFDLRPGEEGRRHAVTSFLWTSEHLDVALLGIAPRPDLPAVAVRTTPLARGRLLYAVHHGGAGPQQRSAPFEVLFPYDLGADALAQLPPRVRASYVQAGAAWQLRGPRWGHHPTLGVAFAAPPGSSGAPVFDALTHELVGIVYAGSPARDPDPWVDHGAVVPIAAVLADLPTDLRADPAPR
jgi:hypothetical protein